MRAVARLAVASLFAVLLPAVLHAQAVRGRVVDADAGSPAVGAIVSLLREDGRRVSPALVGPDGAYVVTAPAPGRFRVRVDLIGYEAWLSDPLPLGLRDTVALDVRLPLKRVELSTVTVQGETRCEARSDQAPQSVALWEEIRRALTISDISAQRRLVPLDLTVVDERRTRHELSRFGRTRQGRAIYTDPPATSSVPLTQERLIGRSQQRVRGAGARPWGERSPAEVAANGFLREVGGEYEYVGPDVPILLSEEFLATHCFHPVRRGRLLGSDELGLAFEPVPGRELPDVKGTIWLDARSSELRRVEFEFVNLPAEVRRLGDARGRLEFARQPDGTWYVQRWEITRGGFMRGGTFTHTTSGEAVPVGTARTPFAPAVLQGAVVDSTVGEGLAGAVVHVPGVEPVHTDSLGRFSVTVPDLPGDSLDVLVSVEHPRLAVLGLASAEHGVRLRAGRPSGLVLAVPSMPTLLAALCPMEEEAAVDARGALRLGMVVGRASGHDGAPLPSGARVVAEWESEEELGEGVEARTTQRALPLGEDGRFRLCPVPLGRTVRLHVETDGEPGPGTELVLSAFGLGQVDLVGRDP